VIAASHDGYAKLVAEALDQLQAHGFALTPVAEKLGVTSTQLSRLFKKAPAAWMALNRHRAAAGAQGDPVGRSGGASSPAPLSRDLAPVRVTRRPVGYAPNALPYRAYAPLAAHYSGPRGNLKR
jgi:hypothetical protein